MDKKTFKVPAIGCNGCVNTIKSELRELTGVASVEGDVEAKTVTVEWQDPMTEDGIVQTLISIEYAPEL